MSSAAGGRDMFATLDLSFTTGPAYGPGASAVSAEPVSLPLPAAVGTGQSSIRGFVFDDTNGNGRRDVGEPARAGRTVYIDEDHDGVREGEEPFDVSGPDGGWSFDNIAGGTYVVAHELSASEAALVAAIPQAPPETTFDIELDFRNNNDLTDVQRQAFVDAAARWERVITGDLPQARVAARDVDDLRIEVRLPDIDGAGGTLAQAAPTAMRSGTDLPYAGFIEVDEGDLNRLQRDGQLFDVVLHELGHVLGIGTVWVANNVITGRRTSNPRFTGPLATAAYQSMYGADATAGGVPVETAGGSGTRDSHWRDSALGDELMTGFVGSGANPLSRVTAASLADVGYTVDLLAADAFGPNVPSVASINPERVKVTLGFGESALGVDFAYRLAAGGGTPTPQPPGATVGGITGTVFEDQNGDGLRNGPDAGIAGATAYIDRNRNGRLERGEPSTLADGAGLYTFTNLSAGTYRIGTVKRAGFARTGPGGLFHDVTISAGQRADGRDFGFARFGSITGRVFNDLNGSGVRDASETAAAGARVFLDLDADGTLDSFERSAVTNAAGDYTLANLRPREYVLRVAAPGGGGASAAATTLPASRPTTISSGATVTAQDFGLIA